MENNGENIQPIDLNPTQNEAEQEADRAFVEGFGEIIGGRKVSITRKRPIWCKGWLETISLADGGDGFNLEYIKENHGGGGYIVRFLNKKGQYISEQAVDIAGPPTDGATPLMSPDEKTKMEHNLELEKIRLQAANAPQAGGGSDLMTMVLTMMTNTQTENAKLLAKLAGNGGGQAGIGQLAEMATLVQTLRGDPGQAGGGAPAAAEAEESPQSMIMKILELYQENQNKQPPPPAIGAEYLAMNPPMRPPIPARPRTGVPPGQGQPIPVQPTGNPAGAPQGEPGGAAAGEPVSVAPGQVDREIPDTDDNEVVDIAEALAELEPDEIAEVLGETFAMASPEKQVALMSLLTNNGSSIENIAASDGGDQEDGAHGEPGETIQNKTIDGSGQ